MYTFIIPKDGFPIVNWVDCDIIFVQNVGGQHPAISAPSATGLWIRIQYLFWSDQKFDKARIQFIRMVKYGFCLNTKSLYNRTILIQMRFLTVRFGSACNFQGMDPIFLLFDSGSGGSPPGSAALPPTHLNWFLYNHPPYTHLLHQGVDGKYWKPCYERVSTVAVRCNPLEFGTSWNRPPPPPRKPREREPWSLKSSSGS